MTLDEIRENWQEVNTVKVKDINGLYDLGCFKRWPRNRSRNIIDARWAITRKMIEGNFGVMCRFTVRGFKDKFQDLGTYARAISRSGQRLANAVAAGNEYFILFSFVVSQILRRV